MKNYNDEYEPSSGDWSDEEMTQALQCVPWDQLPEWMRCNSCEFLSSAHPFSIYMHELLHRKGMRMQNVFLQSDISENYGYKLLEGKEKSRKRDKILKIGIAAQLSSTEMQQALRLYELPMLSPEIGRDRCLLRYLEKGRGSVDEVNHVLRREGWETLSFYGEGKK